MLTNYKERLEQINKMVEDVAQKVLRAHQVSLKSFIEKDGGGFDAVIDLIKTIDDEAREIDNEIVRAIALFGPEASHLRELIAYIKLTNEIVRVGDYAKTYAKNISAHLRNETSFSKIDSYIVQLHEASIEALKSSLEMLKAPEERSEDLFRKTLVEESKTDDIFKLFEKELLGNLCKDTQKIPDFLNILSTCRKLERAADRAVEIAKLLMFAKKGGKLENF